MTSISPLAPLSEILTVPLTKEDFEEEEEGTCDDENFLEMFESTWSSFLREQPALLKGERAERISELQKRVKELEVSKECEELELKRQTAFFQRSREALEEQYAQKMKDAEGKEHDNQVRLEEKLKVIARLEKLQQIAIPWQHFIGELNRLAMMEKQHDEAVLKVESKYLTSKVAKPSACAIMLTDKKVGSSESDVQLRACRIDNALLKTRVAMLQNEIELNEKNIEAQEFTGKVLSGNDI